MDINKIAFGPLIKTKTGRKLVNIFHNNTPIVMQLPKLSAPGGIKEFEDKKVPGKIGSIVVGVSLGKGEQPEEQSLLELIEGIEQKVLEAASENSKEWFNSKEKFEVAEMRKMKMFKSQIRRDEEGKYAPSLTLKLQYYDDKCQTKCYDMDKNLVDYSYITKGSKVTCIVELKSVWIIDNSCGITFRILQCKAQKNQTISDYAFIDEDEPVAQEEAQYEDY
jgi:hypothetical protein